MHHRAQLGAFLNTRQLSGSGAVVGSGTIPADGILEEWKGHTLFVIGAPPADGSKSGLSPVAAAGSSRPGRGNLQVLHLPLAVLADHLKDDSLDFVLLLGVILHDDVRRHLELWYPKLRDGGVLVGDGYIDGCWEGTAYSAKRAVDDFSRARQLKVQVTFDTPPTWFCRKRHAPRGPLDVALLTAFNEGHADLARLSTPNKKVYCARHGYRYIERTEGFAPSRPAAWSKIRFIKEALREHEWVFWSDADSLIMNGSVRLEEFIDEDYDLILSHEDFGQGVYNANTGQMFVRRSNWSMRFLDEVWSQRQFLHDRLWENRAVIHLLWSRDLSSRVQMATQRSFNSYQGNYRDGDFIVHVAGLPHAQRLRLMQEFLRRSSV